jgi:MFS transporter, DHA1 family, multidrug resistance protein
MLTCENSAFGITCFTAGKANFVKDFRLGDGIPLSFIAGMSLYLWGIAFAPIWVPHVTERIGRSIIYLVSLPVCALFVLGAGLSQDLAGVLICRFLAGLTGGPCLVLIEGTFADMWSAQTTNTYYAFLGTAAYFGASLGDYLLPTNEAALADVSRPTCRWLSCQDN